jgi:hypothetical protein
LRMGIGQPAVPNTVALHSSSLVLDAVVAGDWHAQVCHPSNPNPTLAWLPAGSRIWHSTSWCFVIGVQVMCAYP